MTEINQIKSLLVMPKDIVILSHRNPDGDAIGSSLALAHFLRKLKHKVDIILPSECPTNFKYLEGFEEIMIFDLKHDECREKVNEAKIIFCLDFNALDRIDKLGENVQFSKADKIMIDHHLDPEPFADFVISDTGASSTSELVFKFMVDLGYENMIDPKIGSGLFTGLVTDTGSFKYATRPYTYEVAGKLKQLGVDDYGIQNHIFNALKEKHLRLLGHCLANRMEVYSDKHTAMIYLTKQDYKDFNIQRGDTEGIVNYMLMMENIHMAAFIMEQPSIVKISLRSKGSIDVQQIASKNFNGGGHKNASGGSAYAKLEDVLDKFRKMVEGLNLQIIS
ncbi:MAG TPA: bifunctional oligoribonuclease/PAP phosphatase NrnA [Saprospiraceae bacterium]|nr:bifunctional oligoribonuclease/PAP phosphatase NrnA [Saprospiraceae bacterium]